MSPMRRREENGMSFGTPIVFVVSSVVGGERMEERDA
jgi:hypothetical protein